MNSDLDAVKARIRALLAKTVANGCTEGEALAAAAKAFAMLQQHGLNEEQLDMGRAGSAAGRPRRHPIDDLWPRVGHVCRCRFLIVQTAGSLRFDFIGRQPWPEIADWLRSTLQAAHARALADYRQAHEYTRRRLPRTRAAARRQFTVGFVEAVDIKLRRLVGDWDVLRRELASVDRAAAAEFAGARTLPELARADAARDAVRDRAAGQAAGLRTPVNWAVKGDAPKLIGSGHT